MKTTTRIAALVGAVIFGAATAVAGPGLAGGTSASQQPPPVTTNSLGGGINEDLFVPITPCRIVDTRQGSGKLAVGNVTSYLVAGAGPEFAAQGGKTNGCGIPTSATAIEVTMTAVNAGSGFLRVWPSSSGQPNATFMNYTPVFNVSNTGTVAICTSCGFVDELRVRAFGSPTDLVADVGGYYVSKLAASIASNGTINEGNRLVSSTRIETGIYHVVFDRDVTDCSYQVTVSNRGSGVGFAQADGLAQNANGVFIRAFSSATTHADLPFYLEVTC